MGVFRWWSPLWDSLSLEKWSLSRVTHGFVSSSKPYFDNERGITGTIPCELGGVVTCSQGNGSLCTGKALVILLLEMTVPHPQLHAHHALE